MKEPKQVIAVRRDLKMRTGKLAAQVAHASMKVFLDMSRLLDASELTPPGLREALVIAESHEKVADSSPTTSTENNAGWRAACFGIVDAIRKRIETVLRFSPCDKPTWLGIPMTPVTRQWLLDGRFTKIVVGVESEAELVAIHEKAKAAGLMTALIEDLGMTEFHGVKTKTAVAVGPDMPDKVDAITRGLKLM